MNPFPPVESANEEGLLAISQSIDTELLIQAYQNGIFPWPYSEDAPITWFSPDPRGVLPCEDIRYSRNLKKDLKKYPYEIRVNQDFPTIIGHCYHHHRENSGATWITRALINAYCQLFEMQKAYCIEAYLDGQLCGGLYGVCLGNFFSGESMFYFKDHAAKACLAYLQQKLQKQQIRYLDCQMVTPTLMRFGAHHLTRKHFINWLTNECDFTQDSYSLIN